MFLFIKLSQISDGKNQHKGCVQCHQGIESIGEKHEDLDCVDCHQETSSLFWKNVIEKWGEVKDIKIHQDILKKMLIKANN